MQISLRKANVIQVAINEVLKGLSFKTDASINEFQKPEEVIEAANKAFFDNVNRRNALLRAFYEMRKAVASVNAQNGIDDHLANLAFLEKEVTFFTTHSKGPERLAAEVIQGKLSKLAARTEDSYYQKNEVETPIFTQKDRDILGQLAVKAKKEKQRLQDELLELNVRTTITLSDEAVATLNAENIL